METRDPLREALEAYSAFQQAGRCDADAFLRENEALREYLEPLFERPDADADERFGSYRLVRELGRGGMGVVYEAEQVSLGRRVALKLLPLHRSWSPRAIALFRREAQLAAALDHPGIAKIHGLEEIDGELALAMELVRGRSLDRVMDELRPTPPGERSVASVARLVDPSASFVEPSYVHWVAELGRQVAAALAHAHERSVIHRDVKPGNLIVTARGRVVLTDFGLARDPAAEGATRSGDFAGTPEYASPEQLDGAIHSIDGRSDVYALGVTLYELLTGERPYSGTSIAELRTRTRSGSAPASSSKNRLVPRDLDAIVRKAIEPERADRYATAAACAADLERFREGLPVAARPVPRRVRLARWVRRNPVVSAVLVLLVLAGAALAYLGERSRRLQRSYKDLVSDVRLDALWSRAVEVFPPWPAQRAEIDRLCAEAESLSGLASVLEERLVALREGATIAAGGARTLDRIPHRDAARLIEDEAYLVRLVNEARDNESFLSSEESDRLAARGAELEREIALRRERSKASDALRFDDEEARLLYDGTEKQWLRILAMEQDLLRPLRARRALAEEIAREAPGALDERWMDVRKRVEKNARFEGLEIDAQVALVPLGPDPQSGLEEFAHLGSGEAVRRDEKGELALEDRSAIVFVLLPPGELHSEIPAMGEPQRVESFMIGKHELSRWQWIALALEDPRFDLHRRTPLDVRNLSPEQCAKPANAVTAELARALLGTHGLALPREVEWEYACRAGTDGAWWIGDEAANLEGVANIAGIGVGSLIPIHELQPNPFGLHQMHGNAAEWCEDYHGDVRRELCAVRGGSFLDEAPRARTSFRNKLTSQSAARELGLRAIYRLRETRAQTVAPVKG